MKINNRIFNYAFCGIPSDKDRSIIATLENVLLELGVSVNYRFDSESSHYFITSIMNEFCMDLKPNARSTRMIVSPYEYLCILLNQEVDINWFEHLKEGDFVKIGKCHACEHYAFGFNTDLVREFFGKEVTISKIINGPVPIKPMAYFNGDSRAYYIKEIDQFLPSSIFVPQFVSQTPIQKINLISCFIDIDNGLK